MPPCRRWPLAVSCRQRAKGANGRVLPDRSSKSASACGFGDHHRRNAAPPGFAAAGSRQPGPRGPPFPTAGELAEGVRRSSSPRRQPCAHDRPAGHARKRRACVSAGRDPAESSAQTGAKNRRKRRRSQDETAGTLGPAGASARGRVVSLPDAPQVKKFRLNAVIPRAPIRARFFPHGQT